MARFVTGNTFGTTDTVTAAKLNTAVNDAAISTDSVDNNTIELNSNALRLKDSSSKTTGVTFAKMQHISTAQVLGRVSASEGDVEEVGVVIGGSGDAGLLFDNDDMLDNGDTAGGSATRGATQQSIKAYVDSFPSIKAHCVFDGTQSGTFQPYSGSYGITSITRTAGGDYTVTMSVTAPSQYFTCFAGASVEGSSVNRSTGAISTSTTTAQVTKRLPANTRDSTGQISFSAIW